MDVNEWKLNYIYNLGMFSEKQRKHIQLRVDKNGTDKDEFVQLANIEKNIVRFVKDGEQLYIHSQQAGNGKTSWALRLCQAYMNNIIENCSLTCKVLFISVPRFLLELKANISQKSEYIADVTDGLLKADIVIWDDIATKGTTTQFEGEHLLSYIDNRISKGKTNIFTSNLNDQELHVALGDRLASRICNLSYNYELHGMDKRGL